MPRTPCCLLWLFVHISFSVLFWTFVIGGQLLEGSVARGKEKKATDKS